MWPDSDYSSKATERFDYPSPLPVCLLISLIADDRHGIGRDQAAWEMPGVAQIVAISVSPPAESVRAGSRCWASASVFGRPPQPSSRPRCGQARMGALADAVTLEMVIATGTRFATPVMARVP
jgi:hypothetical protein